MSDPGTVFPAMRNLDLFVSLATKLNRSHLLTAKTSIILPVLGRTDVDFQATGTQSVTVEDSMSMVHASRGFLQPPSEHLKSEIAVIAGIARATVGDRYGIDWDFLISNYDNIRDKIEQVFPDFHDFNKRVRVPGGFRLTVGASERVWNTGSGKANFLVASGLWEDPRVRDKGALVLTTLRAHDQYNTTIYAMNDRYRGVFGRRDIVFVNKEDLEARGLAEGDLIDIEAAMQDGDTVVSGKAVRGYTAVEYDIPRGTVGGYYPEFNAVVPLSHCDPVSGTPAYKGIPVNIRKTVAV
jgi:anaerobic selenocysteine-containing dehydrogenase